MTELCNGTLHDLIAIKKDSLTPLSSHQLRDVVLRHIVEGVKHLHDNNIIHRDLTPRNILYLFNPLMMKLADFDCSRFLPQDATHYTRTVTGKGYSKRFRLFGTKGWLAPEVLNGASRGRHLSLGSHLCVHFVWRVAPVRRRCQRIQERDQE